jgi:hypothetical protein
MPRKSARKPQKKRPENDPAQYQRFLEAARVAGASDNPKDLERVLKKAVTPKTNRPSSSGSHR